MTQLTGKAVIIMAGGTGGHVYPALAVADALTKLGALVHWLGNADGFEGEKVSACGYPLHDVRVRGLRGKGAIGWGKAPWMIVRAVIRCRHIMQTVKPDIVIGMGGFISGPGGIAAKLSGIPLVIHEQNAVMGLTNTWLSRIATRILLADARAANKLSKHQRYTVTGNPVRADITMMRPPKERYALRHGKIRLLVLGGSQGAKALNLFLPQALALLSDDMRPQVTHQVGRRWYKGTQMHYDALGVSAKIVPFIEDVAQAYADNDWVIARAGALTVAEIATAGLPALFIPFPFAVDDHQTANAQALVESGAAEIIQERDLSVEKLAAAIAQRQQREDMLQQAIIARQCSNAQALSTIVQIISESIS